MLMVHRDSPSAYVTLESSAERQILIEPPRVDQIRWCPAGGSLLVQGGWARPKLGLYRVWINRQGKDGKAELEPVVEGIEPHQSMNPTFSPDGSKLYFDRFEGPNRVALVEMDLATGLRKKLLEPSTGVLRLFALSPDGRRIAYDIGPPGVTRDQLFVRELVGGEARLITEAEQLRSNGGLIWANGQALLFHSPDPRGIRVDDLIWIPLNGGPSTPMTRSGVFMRMSIHPDGRHLVWQAQTWNMEVSRIRNVFRERTQK